MPRLVMLAALLLAGTAWASGGRVRWRGIETTGHPPPALQSAVAAHVAVALRQLGSSLVTAPPADAEAAAVCTFSGGKVARCVVGVFAGGARVDRRAQIPYRDAEDLAETLSLLVADILSTDFPDVVSAPRPSPAPPGRPPASPVGPPPSPVGPAPSPQGPAPPPGTPPPGTPPSGAPPSGATPPAPPPPSPLPAPSPPPREDDAALQARLAAERARQAELARRAEAEERAQRAAAHAAARAAERARRRREAALHPPRWRPLVEAGPAGVFGVGPDNPTLVGGVARAMAARALLRLGGSLAVAGMRETLGGHDLTFVRLALAARAGVGFRGALVDFDLSGGPALLLLLAEAHGEARHELASLAFVAGPRLGLTLAGPIALVLGADVTVAVTDEQVTSGGARVAQFSHTSVDVVAGLRWTMR